jgi:hypothetical protein
MTGRAVAAADLAWWARGRQVREPFRFDALRRAVASLID